MGYGLIDKSTPSADQQFNAEFMRMWQHAKDQQAKALKKKNKSVIAQGLESKLRDPNSQLSDSEEKTVDRILRHGVQDVGGPFSLLGDNRF